MNAVMQTSEGAGTVPQQRFEVRFARTPEEIRETQQLRYRIFAGELGAQIDGGEAGIDHDQYDPYCRHLMVRDLENHQLAACTRILSGEGAANAGGFYSASEFDLAMLDSLPGKVMEIGRTCVDADYRGGAAIALLWQGIAACVVEDGYDYLFGCASIDLADGGATAHSILDTLRGKYLAEDNKRVRPFIPLPAADARCLHKPKMPPLLKAYLSLGAKACGEAYWDRDFNCADIFMLLDVSELNPRYARHFLGHARSAALAEERMPLAA